VIAAGQRRQIPDFLGDADAPFGAVVVGFALGVELALEGPGVLRLVREKGHCQVPAWSPPAFSQSAPFLRGRGGGRRCRRRPGRHLGQRRSHRLRSLNREPPVAGPGINLAIQDAVVAANLLWAPLQRGQLSMRDLAKVQRQREIPVRIIQAVQSLIQRLFFRAVLSSIKPPVLPQKILRLLLRVPVLGDLPARFVAFGIRRPHVESPALAPLAAGPALELSRKTEART
jgi:hypothetical protein